MSTRTKWIWTLVVLLIVVVLGSAAFAAGSRFGFGGRGEFGMMERGYNHMQPFERHALGFRSPFGWLGMGLGMILMLTLPLGFLALAVVGGISLIRGAGAQKPASVAAPAAASSAPVVEPAVAAATTVLRECESCGKLAQADWKTCPYCGTQLG